MHTDRVKYWRDGTRLGQPALPPIVRITTRPEMRQLWVRFKLDICFYCSLFVNVPILQIIYGFVLDRMKKIALIANALKDQSQVMLGREAGNSSRVRN